jgi:transcription elongation GreA/GreB family factor/very-short-patch-repair endonuclease
MIYKLTERLLSELQRRLKIGNRRGVHLNAIPANSRYKFDLKRLSHISKTLPDNFIKSLLSEQPLKFRVSWKDNVPDLNSLFEEEQTQLIKITKAFENLINQTETIESEKGINTFGFGFPILVRRDKADNKLTVAPVLIWSLKIKRTKEYNTWEILRNEEDPIYINEVLINHLQNDSKVEIEQIPSEMLDDGLIQKEELIEICSKLIRTINTNPPNDLEEVFVKKLNTVVPIGDKTHYEKLPINSTNALIEFGGLFSIFEVQKQNIINEYSNLMELKGIEINLDNLKDHLFQPISSVETDPSQQSILHSLEDTRNILIQGPPGTGKSQTLTAVLINALENNKKTIVVCEKRTALEVLHSALIEKELNYHCILIRDIIKDRKTVVDSVRERIDNSEYRRYKFNYSKDSLDNIIKKAKSLINIINRKHRKLDEKIIGNKSWSNIVGELLKELSDKTYENNLKIGHLVFQYTQEELNRLLDIIQKGESLYRDYFPIEQFSFINPEKFIGNNPYIIEEKINEDFDLYALNVEEIKQLLDSTKKEYVNFRNTELKKQVNSIKDLINEISTKENELKNLISNAKDDYYCLRRAELNQQNEDYEILITQIDDIYYFHQNNPDLTNENRINGFTYKFLSKFSKTKKKTITDYSILQNLFSRLEKISENAKDYKFLNPQGPLSYKYIALQKLKNNIIVVKNSFDSKIEGEFLALNLNSIFDLKEFHFKEIQEKIINANTETQKVLQKITINLSKCLSETKAIYQTLSNELVKSNEIRLIYTFENSLSENKLIISEIQLRIEDIQNKFKDLIKLQFDQLNLLKANTSEINIKSWPLLQEKANNLVNKFTSDNWTKAGIKTINIYLFLTELDSYIKLKNNYFNSDKDQFLIEFNWFQFYNTLSGNELITINELLSKTDWQKSFLSFYLNSLLLNSASMDLPTSDIEHKELNGALNEIEKEQLRFIKEFWYSKQIDATIEFEQNNNGLSVENLYNKRSSRNYKRLSIRQIVQKDADLFSTFFPIILTSPDVASNLFKGMNQYFDIVMFDEASQLRLEDNLPAILKGKQIIIAGDEHQMPPSNYFSKVFDGAIEDEDDIDEEEDVIKLDKDDILLSCESLLDFGTELNFQKKHLDFHYRSRHPYLIDFSNYAFYNQRLKPLPNNFHYVPIKYIQVNGTFSDHTNESEAEMVLSILENNINRLPSGEYPTIGIATFNIAQRNLIKSKILERQKFSKYADFNAKIQELEEMGMFIKNLENIQGDERDVIILSTTYGIGKDGKFAQRFGPINLSKGYKLLNVIITRAKYKVYCCSSIPEQAFMNYKENLTIEGSNNKKAVFYAYLAYCKAVSDADNESRLSVLTSLAENTSNSSGINPKDFGELESPFEEEVYQILADHFGTEKLIPQLKFAGFRIDIVYDPKIVGIPKIAIECDGAKYHSSREAYLYDRHRQKILENHGFIFHRIWSTNWWRNSNRESKILIDFIIQTEASVFKESKDLSKTANAFTDDIKALENYVSQISFNNLEREIETIKAVDHTPSIITTSPSESIVKTENIVKLNSKVKVKYMNNGTEIVVQIVSTEKNENVSNNQIKIFEKSPLAVSLLGHKVGDIIKIGKLDNFVEIITIN